MKLYIVVMDYVDSEILCWHKGRIALFKEESGATAYAEQMKSEFPQATYRVMEVEPI